MNIFINHSHLSSRLWWTKHSLLNPMYPRRLQYQLAEQCKWFFLIFLVGCLILIQSIEAPSSSTVIPPATELLGIKCFTQEHIHTIAVDGEK